MFSVVLLAGSYVTNGVSQVEVVSSNWNSSNGYLEDTSGTSTRFYTNEAIANGDFSITCDIELGAINLEKCSLDFGYKNRIFFNRLGQFSVEGSYFTSSHRHIIEEIIDTPIAASTRFTFVLSRTGSQVIMSIDGIEVYNRDDNMPSEPAQFYLRSDDTNMKIYNFSATGALTTYNNEIFARGEAGYAAYRIPGMIKVDNGTTETLIAFAEGRVNGSGDSGNIDIVCKRSTDGGETWSALEVVWDDAGNCCGNPTPVVINQGTPQAEIILACTWNLGSTHESAIKSYTHTVGATEVSNMVRQPHIIRSSDSGQTWGAAINISNQATKFDNTPGSGDNWNWYAAGPGNAIVLENGPNAGRIVIPCNHSGDDASKTYNAHTIYSDDNGITWDISTVTRPGGAGPNESCIAELSDGTLLINSRMQGGGYQNRRGFAWSSDSGETWDNFTNLSNLRGPTCQAAMLRYRYSGTNTLLFLNPQSPDGRYGELFSVLMMAVQTGEL